jgi:hypothetical protein
VINLTGAVRLPLVFAVIAGVWAGTSDGVSPESSGLLEQIKRHVIEDLAGLPNYVCVDAIERSLWI